MTKSKLTGYDATIKYGYTRLASLVHYLKKNHNIVVESIEEKNAHDCGVHSQYWIDSEKNKESLKTLFK